MDLEGFCITMQTLSDILKISNREDALWPGQPLPTKFLRREMAAGSQTLLI